MDKIFSDLSDWIREKIEKAVDSLVELKLKDEHCRLISRKAVAKMLDIEPATFDKHYRYMDGFPKELPACKWSKPAVMRWIEEQY